MKNKVLIMVGLLGTFINLFLAVEFFNTISKIFVIFIIMLQLAKATYLYMLPLLDKKMKRFIFVIIIILCSLFDLIGVIANCYNTLKSSINLNYKVCANYKFKEWEKQQENLNLAIKEAENKINTYPNLESYTANSPSWEDKTQIISIWQDGKNKLLETKNKLSNDLLELNKNIPSKTIKVKVSNKGYENLISLLSKKLKVSSEILTLFLAIAFSILIEMIVYSSFLARKLEVKKFLGYNKKFLGHCRTFLGQNKNSLGQNKNSLGHSRTQKNSEVKTLSNEEKALPIDIRHIEIPKTLENSKVEHIENDIENKSLGHSRTNNENVLGQNKNVLENVLEYLTMSYKQNECIEKFQVKFGLTEYEYKKIRNELIERNIIECKNKRMYFKTNLRKIK